MLELRPNCEHCNKDLPPHSTEAMMCSYECTFCTTCVKEVLNDVCPNCGGNFCARPIRPKNNLKGNNYLGQHPASTIAVLNPVNKQQHRLFSKHIKQIVAHKR